MAVRRIDHERCTLGHDLFRYANSSFCVKGVPGAIVAAPCSRAALRRGALLNVRGTGGFNCLADAPACRSAGRLHGCLVEEQPEPTQVGVTRSRLGDWTCWRSL